jgi:DNA-binding Lrp family transcriptional regulator
MTKTRVFAAATFLVAAVSLPAQQYKSLTSVATFKVAPDKVDAFVARGKAFVPTLDKLLDAGVITAYGIDVDMLHVPDSNNVVFWVDSPDFTSLAKSEDAIEEFMRANPTVMQDIHSMTDMSTHRDFIVRSWEENHRAVPAGATPVSDFDMVRVKPQRMEEYIELFRKYDKPVLDKLIADGVIYGYTLDTEAVHTMQPGFVWAIVEMPDLGTKDKVRAAYGEAMKKLPDGEQKLLESTYFEMVDFSTHRDNLATSVVFRQK